MHMPKIPFKQLKVLLTKGKTAAKKAVKVKKKFVGIDAESRKYLNAVSPYWQRLGQTYGVAIEHKLPEKNVNIKAEIEKMIDHFNKDYNCRLELINTGHCAEFADELIEKTGGLVVGNDHPHLLKRRKLPGGGMAWSQPDMPGHVWIFWKGKHYDAMTRDGVKDWRDLDIFKSQGVFEPEKKKINPYTGLEEDYETI